ncbi:unnamed protein product [Amoebophrya sp. A25]|nr:unnamed protein product [Amoebophrya sp. A25]|eukprot:GSA25T00016181001.1
MSMSSDANAFLRDMLSTTTSPGLLSGLSTSGCGLNTSGENASSSCFLSGSLASNTGSIPAGPATLADFCSQSLGGHPLLRQKREQSGCTSGVGSSCPLMSVPSNNATASAKAEVDRLLQQAPLPPGSLPSLNKD